MTATRLSVIEMLSALTTRFFPTHQSDPPPELTDAQGSRALATHRRPPPPGEHDHHSPSRSEQPPREDIGHEMNAQV